MDFGWFDWAKIAISVSFLCLQIWLFRRIGAATRLQYRINLREEAQPPHKRGRKWPSHHEYVRLSQPHGAIFLSVGILGTFMGLLLSVVAVPDVTDAIFGAVDAQSRNGVIYPFVIGVGMALASSILGITLALLAKATWRSVTISEMSSQKIKEKISDYYAGLPDDEGNAGIEGENPFSVFSVLILCKSIQDRADVVDYMVEEAVEKYLGRVTDLINKIESKRSNQLNSDPDLQRQLDRAKGALASIRTCCGLDGVMAGSGAAA